MKSDLFIFQTFKPSNLIEARELILFLISKSLKKMLKREPQN